MEEEILDYVLVPLGVLIMASYHSWLLITILRNPSRTTIGLNAESRRQWVFSIMADPLKNGTLAVQTIRNNMMASTLLATTAITLCSLISVFLSNTSNSSSTGASELVYGNKSPLISSIKHFSILLCFLFAFLCNVQCIRYYAHVSFLITLSFSKGKIEAIDYVSRNLNRGSYFWSLGLRGFYMSFPLLLWTFGPVPMLACCFVMSFLLYFLDTTTPFTRQLHNHSFKEDMEIDDDVFSAA